MSDDHFKIARREVMNMIAAKKNISDWDNPTSEAMYDLMRVIDPGVPPEREVWYKVRGRIAGADHRNEVMVRVEIEYVLGRSDGEPLSGDDEVASGLLPRSWIAESRLLTHELVHGGATIEWRCCPDDEVLAPFDADDELEMAEGRVQYLMRTKIEAMQARRKRVEDLIEKACISAIAAVQDDIGQTDGGHAAMHFDENGVPWHDLKEVVGAYIHFELSMGDADLPK